MFVPEGKLGILANGLTGGGRTLRFPDSLWQRIQLAWRDRLLGAIIGRSFEMDEMTNGGLLDGLVGALGSLGIIGTILAIGIGVFVFNFFFRD